jgi:very-short-patch-repair endonuclease
VIEIDGGQHGLPGNADAEARRTMYIEAAGFTVVRFWNNDVLARTESVVEAIARAVAAISGGEQCIRGRENVPPP